MKKTFAVLVAALVVAAGGCATDSGPPTATFSGTNCGYDGLPEFTPGDVVTVTFNNNSDVEAGVEVVKILNGTSMDEIDTDGPDAYEDETIMSGLGRALAGESTSFEFLFGIEGDWLVNCFTDSDYPATILEVSG